MEENSQEITLHSLPAHSGRIFIRNLSFHCSDSDLKKLLEENCFAISEAKAFTSSPNNRNPSRKPMYYGYVELCDPTEIELAMSTLNGKLFMGRCLSVQRYMPYQDHHHHHYSNENISPNEGQPDELGGERYSDHFPDSEFGDRAYQLHVSFKAQTLGVSILLGFYHVYIVYNIFSIYLILEAKAERRKSAQSVSNLW